MTSQFYSPGASGTTNGPRTLVLYPNQSRLTEAEERELVESESAARVTGDMMTIGAFESRLQESLLPPAELISPLARHLLTQEVARRHFASGGGDALRTITRFRGFITSLLSLFDELGAGLVAPSDLDRIRGYAPTKENDIRLLYHAYRQALQKSGYGDAPIRREELLEALRREESFTTAPLNAISHIRLVDIYQFTPYRFELIRALARHRNVTVVAPVPDGRQQKAFGFVERNLEKFEALGDAPIHLDLEWRERTPNALTPFTNRLFASDETVEEPPPLSNTITLLRCASRYREIEEAGSALRAAHREGVAWRDMALVVRDIPPYGAIIDDVFRRYAIPHLLRRGLSLARQPATRPFLALFGAIENGYVREDICHIITSPYFRRYQALDADRVEPLMKRCGVIDGAPELWKKKLAPLVHKKNGEGRIARHILHLLEKLEALRKDNRPDSFFARLAKTLDELRYDVPDQNHQALQNSHRFADNSAIPRVKESVSEAAAVAQRLPLGDRSMTFEQMTQTLIGRIEESPAIDPPLFDEDSVRVVMAHDAIGLTARMVVICGLHEKEFPRQSDDRSLLGDDERLAFNRAHSDTLFPADHPLRKGRTVFDSAFGKWEEETLLFYQATTAATQKLLLTYCETDLGGKTLLRSQFIDDALDALAPGAEPADREKKIVVPPRLTIQKDFPELGADDERLMKLLHESFEQDVPLTNERKALLGKREQKKLAPLFALAAMERKRDTFFIEQTKETQEARSDSFTGTLRQTALLRAVLAESMKSRYAPTDLEKYGQCPYRYFAAKLLRLKPEDDPQEELDPRSLGSLCHEILENFYQTLISKGRLPMTGEEKELLEKISAASFAQLEEKGESGDPTLFTVQKVFIDAMLRRILKKERHEQAKSGYLPAALELKFDIPEKEPDHPPFSLLFPSGEERHLTGLPDRIDINSATRGIRVVDYKTSSNTQKYRKMLRQESMGVDSFQVPLYLLMAKAWVKSTGALADINEMKGAYLLLRATGKNNPHITSNDSKEESDLKTFLGDEAEFMSRLITTLERLESGQFIIQPKSCEFCDYTGLCRYVASPTAEEGES